MLTATEINLTKEFEKIERPGKIWKIIWCCKPQHLISLPLSTETEELSLSFWGQDFRGRPEATILTGLRPHTFKARHDWRTFWSTRTFSTSKTQSLQVESDFTSSKKKGKKECINGSKLIATYNHYLENSCQCHTALPQYLCVVQSCIMLKPSCILGSSSVSSCS